MEAASVANVELHIRGPESGQRLQLTISEGEVVRLGRSLRSGFPVPWDLQISREHADLCVTDGKLSFSCLPHAANPIQFKERMVRAAVFVPGDSFKLGETEFLVRHSKPQEELATFVGDALPEVLDESTGSIDLEPSEETRYSADELRSVRFLHAEEQLEILANLPELINESHSDEELAGLLVKLLLKALPHATAVAVVRYSLDALESNTDSVDPPMMQVETRREFFGRFAPSQRLMREALTSQHTVLHMWTGDNLSYTITEGLGWAFASPIGGESCRGWCLYVSGQLTHASEEMKAKLKGDLRFTGLVAQFIGSVRQVRMLQEQKTVLSQFFSPSVMDGLKGQTWSEALRPRERDVTVLFCDLRGFSHMSERMQHDLLRLLTNVSTSLGMMVNGILERDGAIADFQGDAVLGFWGWPEHITDGPLLACRAALDIQSRFEQAREFSQLDGLSVGIGIAYGRALAGRIGTDRQSKIGVFGPVVNQGSRLEGMTKQLGVRICIDDATAENVRRSLGPLEGRLRHIAAVRPVGMDTAIGVHELLPPMARSGVVEAVLIKYQRAMDAALRSDWATALAAIDDDTQDGPSRLLRSICLEKQQDSDQWDGIIQLSRKK